MMKTQEKTLELITRRIEILEEIRDEGTLSGLMLQLCNIKIDLLTDLKKEIEE